MYNINGYPFGSLEAQQPQDLFDEDCRRLNFIRVVVRRNI